jgi:hypothetical protein
MLSQHDRELLTAFVDGEVSNDQHQKLTDLLRQSAEARDLLRALEQDARSLRQLPQLRVPTDLSASVLMEIVRRRLVPAPAPTLPPVRLPQPGVPAWAALTIAAGLLLSVGVASYLFFRENTTPPGNPVVVQSHTGTSDPDKGPSNVPPPGPVVVLPDKTPEPDRIPEKPDPVTPDPIVGVPTPDPDTAPEHDPTPVRPSGPVFTGPSGERYEMRQADIFPPAIFRVLDLDQPASRQALVADLKKANAFRMELPCKDGNKATERLQAVLKERKVSLTVDPVAQSRLTKTQWKTSYLLLVDNVLPEELADLVARFAAADHKIEPKKPAEPQLNRLVLTRWTRMDQKDLADHLGADPGSPPALKVPGPLGTDIHRPLSDQTAEQVGKALDGNKAHPECQALLVAYTGSRILTPSAEVKRFLEARKQPRPGAVQVLLVLRTVG